METSAGDLFFTDNLQADGDVVQLHFAEEPCAEARKGAVEPPARERASYEGIEFNPAAQTRRSLQYDRADKRPFSIEELRVYWRLLRDRPGVEAATLRIHLLTAISTTSGKKPISVRTLAGWARAVVGSSIEGFQLKRLRSGVETLLAANGISREVRGQLQSHGLTGVQARHYDGHDYMREKREALDLLLKVLEYSDRQRQPITTERRAADRMPNVVALRTSGRARRATLAR